jgi:hypothetical protein
LRAHFEKRFANPRSTDRGRLVWDYWHVPGQYTVLRTPAWEYFPKKIYDQFHQKLVAWGRENLGCHDVSPPWLSLYVDGMEQKLHADVPHGPWAFVYSVCPKKLGFTGGDTLLLNPEILDYWNPKNRDSMYGAVLEDSKITTRVSPEANQLTLFDPRIPHGVSPVSGTQGDPLLGRLVIHGWFVNPRPFISGPLNPQELSHLIDEISVLLPEVLTRATLKESQDDIPMPDISPHGTWIARFNVSSSGRVTRVQVLGNQLRSLTRRQSDAITYDLTEIISEFGFSKKSKSSVVTLPLQFGAED